MIVERCYDSTVIYDALTTVDYTFPVELWLAAPENVALVCKENGSVALFEYFAPAVYTGHYFFTHACRGKAAKELANIMLVEAFGFANVIRGLVPLQNLASRWMTRQLGFTSYGAITANEGPCELFIMTREQFSNKDK